MCPSVQIRLYIRYGVGFFLALTESTDLANCNAKQMTKYMADKPSHGNWRRWLATVDEHNLTDDDRKEIAKHGEPTTIGVPTGLLLCDLIRHFTMFKEAMRQLCTVCSRYGL